MRVFWLLLAVLIGGGLAAWLIGGQTEPKASISRVAEQPTSAPPAPTTPTPAPPAHATAPAPVATPAMPTPTPKPDAPATTARDAVRSIDARTLLLDGRFEVIGRGTEQDPFRIGWPLLLAAMEEIDASAGKLAVPRWLEPLDSSWIEISGYFAPILKSESVSEVLFTMNRWDGCCIGLPPTVFDSIALKLRSPVSLVGQHLIRFGTVRGELHVEPFAAGGMMLGLYRLEDGTITTQNGG